MSRLDPRLTTAGLAVRAADLAAVLTDHHPGDRSMCRACGHHYTTAARVCPSYEVARVQLRHRRHEDPGSAEPIVDLLDERDTRMLPAPAPLATASQPEGLFAVDPGWRRPGWGRL
jgi:hypothetical protein